MAQTLETPDGRYIIVHGRLWRHHRPDLQPVERDHLVRQLMDARRAVRGAKRAGNAGALVDARKAVDAAKHALGERGPVWWTDGSPDLNRHLIKNTPYADWYAGLSEEKKGDTARR